MSEKIDSALEVQPGVTPPPQVNPSFAPHPRRKDSTEELIRRLRDGDRGALARAITLIESHHAVHGQAANDLLDQALPYSGQSIRIGLTGVPGVGKSTLLNRLGMHLVEHCGRRLAVLAVDPSSAATRGSILGDKSRMPDLAVHRQAFVRPSAAGRSLGGVAHKTRETITLCEAAGYDTIFVETVGVGQSETAVHGLCDCFVLLMLSGAGDELQGMKRGIMELADIVAVTKADGDNEMRAELARHQAENALHYLAPNAWGWKTPTLCCSASTGLGIEVLWDSIMGFIRHVQSNGWFSVRRQAQDVDWMEDLVMEGAVRDALLDPGILTLRDELEPLVRRRELTPRRAAQQILSSMRQRGDRG